jgi:hypothetical protein
MNSLISLDQTIVRDWLLDLPKTLWQLQTKSSHASQVLPNIEIENERSNSNSCFS